MFGKVSLKAFKQGMNLYVSDVIPILNGIIYSIIPILNRRLGWKNPLSLFSNLSSMK